MSEKRISLSDGFEDEVKSLDGRDFPNSREMMSVDGLKTGLGSKIADSLGRGGSRILGEIAALDRKLQIVQNHIHESLADYRSTEESIASDLKAILAELDGIRGDVQHEVPAASDEPAPTQRDGSRGLPRAQ